MPSSVQKEHAGFAASQRVFLSRQTSHYITGQSGSVDARVVGKDEQL